MFLFGIAASAAPVGARLLRAPGPSVQRWVSLAAALLLLGAVWFSPLQTLSQHYLLTAHLVQVLVLMGAVPPLLLLALAPAPPLRWWPRLRRLGHLVVHPASAIVGVNAVFFLTNWSVAMDYGLSHPWAFDLGQLALLGASVAFWWPIIGPDGRRSLLSPLGKLGYILLATIPQTFAGLILALSPRVMYAAYLAAPRVFNLSAHADQQIAGACLAVLSKIALFAAFSVIFVRVMNPGPDADDGGGGGGHQDEPAPPPPAGEPAWYRQLDSGPLQSEPAPRRRVTPARSPVGGGGGGGRSG